MFASGLIALLRRFKQCGLEPFLLLLRCLALGGKFAIFALKLPVGLQMLRSN